MTYFATTEEFDLGIYKSNKSLIVNYHSVVFENLNPNTLYAYRVGNDETSNSKEFEARSNRRKGIERPSHELDDY